MSERSNPERPRESTDSEHHITSTDHLGHTAVSRYHHKEHASYATDKQFDEFYKREHELLLRFARRKLNKIEDAEDVLAEAMIGIWNRWDELKLVLNEPSGESRLRSFARTVIIRRAYDFYRQYYKYGTFTDIDDIEIGSPDYPELYIINWDVEQLIDELSDREATILRMAMLGATRIEIAQILGLSQGGVRNYLSFARKNLRKNMHLTGLLDPPDFSSDYDPEMPRDSEQEP